VCDELGLPSQEVDDVTAVIASMRADCTIADGEAAPRNPGKPAPPGDSLYARLGGVYPIALFADRLVDALLSDTSVSIKLSKHRTMASLKYLFTELCCALAGGPEILTAPFVRDTRLGLSGTDFFKLLGCVQSSADHVGDAVLAVELTAALHGAMDLVVAQPPCWDGHISDGRTHAEVATAVKAAAEEVGAPLFYVPTEGRNGFLLAMERGVDGSDGVDSAAHARRLKATQALGFEESDSVPGVASIGTMTFKDVLFCIDISGSMRGKRIESATDNALRVFDGFTNDDDYVGLTWFDHRISEKFDLTPRGEGGLRAKIDSTRTAVAGGTAFFDALVAVCAKERRSANSYIVALTDGVDMHSKADERAAKASIAESSWTLLIVGLEVDRNVRQVCERLASASPNGKYMHANDAGAGLDEAFAKVAAQFAMPKVKSADAAAAGGGTRGV
jgi:Mg-chelatase subunit ChlD